MMTSYIYIHDVANKILSRDSIFIVDVVMWPKFGKSSISQFYIDLTKKTDFLSGGFGSSSVTSDWH